MMRAWIRYTKYVEMMTNEGSTKIVNFMTPGAGVLVPGCIDRQIKSIVMMRAWIRYTKYVEMMTNEGSTKIVNFMTPGAGVLVPGFIVEHLRSRVKEEPLLRKTDKCRALAVSYQGNTRNCF
ncbi:uncharacterized protein LOC111102747 isoform X2 [Crassostrea virginica]